MSKKLPAIQFYPGDWRKDPGIQALDYETRGIWLEILMLMHESEDRGKLVLNGQAMPEEALSHILGLEVAKVQQTLSKLLSYGVASREANTNIIYNRRMCRDEALRQVRAEAGKQGGKQTASKREANTQQNPTPSSSSSISSSTSVKKKVPKKKFVKPTIEEVTEYCRERNNGIDPQHFIDSNEAKGWVVGKNKTPMQDWKAVVRTWETYGKQENKPAGRITRATNAIANNS